MKILIEKAVIEQALEALEELHYSSGTVVAAKKYESATAALRKALDPELQFVRDWNEGKVRRVSDGKVMGFAEQAEQEPVAWMVTMENQDGTKKTFPLSGRYKDVRDTCDFGDPIPLYAAPVEPVKQEPVACIIHTEEGDYLDWNSKGYCFYTGETPLYAAPVRTKDLTDEEINEVLWRGGPFESVIDSIRSVIAADRKKNR